MIPWAVQKSHPGALGGGKKGQISLNFHYNVYFKDFYTKLCVSSHNVRYITYHTGFLFGHLGHAPGVGLGDTWGGGSKIYISETQPNLVFELLTWMACQLFDPCTLGPWRGTKRLNIIKFQLQSQFQRFLNQTSPCTLLWCRFFICLSFGIMGFIVERWNY